MNKMKAYFSQMETKKKIEIFLVLFIIISLSIILPNSFAALDPVKSVTILSETTNYVGKEAGSWQIEKSAKWIKKGVAEITFDVDTVLKASSKYTDILFVLDISGSMSGDKIDRVKSDTIDLMNTLLSNNKNHAGLITFDDTSTIVSDLTNDKNSLIEKVNEITVGGCTNYYQALVNVDVILKHYQKEEDRECIVLFLTDGYPNADIPNEQSQYRYLKSEYPYVTINGVQYEMGNDILDPIKKVSDNQYIADMKTLNNVLFDASVSPAIYDNFEITDFIDTDYFYVESENDIKVSEGKVTFNKTLQTINWRMDHLKSGSQVKMVINAKLKDEYIEQGGVYPTNKKEEIKSKIEEITEDVISPKTPLLSVQYKVIYEGNAPEECSVTGLPAKEDKTVFDIVEVSDQKPTCNGYEFKGWEITTKDVSKINKDYFVMPEKDVILRAKWGRVVVKKSMDGTIETVPTLYKIMKTLASPDDEKSEFVTSSTGIDFSKAPSNTNGKGVYQLAASKNEEYPILYYRGAVTNNNVKFGGFCWKIVRTTETGGVKLVYNGEPDADGDCTNTIGEDTQIGTSKFNNSNYSPADVGYMYGNRGDYTYDYKGVPTWYTHTGYGRYRQTQISVSYNVEGNYYYGNSVEWNSKTQMYVLKNVSQIEWLPETYKGLKGKYRCQDGTQTSCSRVYYIGGTLSSYMYYISLTNNQTLEDRTFYYSKSVTYNNGVYTLNNPIKAYKSDWYTNYLSYSRTYICPDNSTSCSKVNYAIGTSTSDMDYLTLKDGDTSDSLHEEAINKKWIYGNDVEWDGTKYTLKDTYENTPINYLSYYKEVFKKYRYTCLSTSNSCTEVKYLYYFDTTNNYYYLILKDGKNIEDAKKEMFTNIHDSTVKTIIDSWYQSNMLDYTEKLEDTVWCNDRSIEAGPLKSKDEDSSVNTSTTFGASGRNVRKKVPSVACPNKDDSFTVDSKKGNGMLTYPVALLTADELTLAGHGESGYNSSSYLYTNSTNLLLSPREFKSNGGGSRIFSFDRSGKLDKVYTDSSNGIRPAVSLVPGSAIDTGDGSPEDPFTIIME